MLSEQDLKFASVSSVCTDPIFGHCSKTHVSSAKTTPLSADRFALQLTMSRATHDKLRYAQELLSHRVRPGDVAEVLDRALDALIVRLEKQKFAAASTARPRMGPSPNHRHVSAHVKRAVWARDQGRCTFVGDSGHRCNARQLLEFDHTEPVARGGRATVASMRLRCRAHNQYEAERAFGAEFMSAKRAAARQRTADARARAAAAKALERSAARRRDVGIALRRLGFRADEVRRGTEFSETAHAATLEAQLIVALRYLRPDARSIARSQAHSAALAGGLKT